VNNTYAACLTPPGAGAIAVIAVRGPRAWEAVGEIFQPYRAVSGTHETCQAPLRGLAPPANLDERRFYLGRFGDDSIDEVVLSIRQKAPVPWLEIHCHGGAEVVRMCLECLAKRGIQICTWRELLQLTVDSSIGAAVAAEIAQARTVRTAAILLDQYQGAFEEAVRAMGDSKTMTRLLDELVARIPLGRHLVEPWRVVVAGSPNVGKSSLVNALAGYQRSIVSEVPGTTRDLVTTAIAVDGWPVELTDTAGIRAEAVALEEQGVVRARTAAAGADLCLWVMDGSESPIWPAAEASEFLVVINKTDLPPAWDWQQANEAIRVSARTGAGLSELCDVLAARLVPQPPPAGTAVPFTPELCAAVEEAQRLCRAGETDAARETLLRSLAKPVKSA
jgi:tRNA modification GTPase